MLIAAVEGGGTSFVVAVAEIDPPPSPPPPSSSKFVPPKILHRHEVDSSHDSPQRTLQECAEFFRKHNPCNNHTLDADGNSGKGPSSSQGTRKGYDALGVASFGPVGLDPTNKATYGKILPSTPKQNWRNVDILKPLIEACKGQVDDNSSNDGRDGNSNLLVKIDTDVNAPAVAEFMAATAAASQTLVPVTSVAYVTVGTGVGVGLVVNSKPVHGRMHPEAGHIPIQPLPADKTIGFDGYSWGSKAPFFGRRTVESMTSSVALTERLQKMSTTRNKNKSSSSSSSSSASSRQVLAEIDDDDHEIWDHAANSLACLCVSLILTLSIERIVLGGGVMKRNGLIDKIRSRTSYLMNGYVDLPPVNSDEMKYLISTSSFGRDIGLIGAMVLAQRAIIEDMEDNTADSSDNNKKKKKGDTTTAFYVGAIHGVIVGAAISLLGWMALTTTGNNKRSSSK